MPAGSDVLLLLHFQREIVEPDGAIGRMGNAEQIESGHVLDHVRALLVRARHAAVPVVHIASAYQPGYPGLNRDIPHFARAADAGLLQIGSPGAEFVEAAAPAAGETVLFHAGIGVFASSTLPDVLSSIRPSRLVVCGVSTRLVVEATVFGAADRGYSTTVVTDCCASRSIEAQRDALQVLSGFATLRTAAEMWAGDDTHSDARAGRKNEVGSWVR